VPEDKNPSVPLLLLALTVLLEEAGVGAAQVRRRCLA
jgi:hypothetical protein